MKFFEVDEGDARWHRTDPQFRICVFSGEAHDVTIIDTLETYVIEALDAAKMLSEDNEHLWSLALVEQNADEEHGLVWLSGYDYRVTPNTTREWHIRQQMQLRYLSKRASTGRDIRLPSGERLIRMFHEWSRGWPLWESFTNHYRLTPEELQLPRDLRTALYEWNDAWCTRIDENDPLPPAWASDGRALWQELRHHLQGVAEVHPQFIDDSTERT